MKVKIRIPDYLSIEHYQKLGNLEHLSMLDKAIKTISLIGDVNEHDIRKWSTKDIQTISTDFSNFTSVKEVFYPIFEWEGILFGYRNLNDMTLGEFVDLERLAKKPTENLHEIMAILYRPIEKHQFKSFKWNVVHQMKVQAEQSSNIFKAYTLKEYDNKQRVSDGMLMKNMPVAFALGALDFFLATSSEYINNTLPYSTDQQMKTKEEITQKNLKHMVSIGGGLRQFIHYPKEVYSISQEKQILLT